jgi:hypothetical protein
VVEGGDGVWDASDGSGDRTTSNDMARDVLYMIKNFHFNSGDPEYSPSIDPDEYLQRRAVLTVVDGDGACDAGDGAGDRTTSNDVARDVLYMIKNFLFNSGDVEYSPSVDRDGFLAGSAHRWDGAGAGDVGDGAGDRTRSNDMATTFFTC